MEVSKYKSLTVVGEAFLLWQAIHFIGGIFVSPFLSQTYPHLPLSTVVTLTTTDFAPVVAILYMSLRLRGCAPKLNFGYSSVRGTVGGIILAWLGSFVALVFFDKANAESQEILALPEPYIYHGVFAGAIWNPFLEEILTRGYFFEILRKKWSLIFSLIVSTLLFVVPHGMWGGWSAGLIWITFNSLIYTFVYIEGGVWAAAMTHMFVNSYILYLNL